MADTARARADEIREKFARLGDLPGLLWSSAEVGALLAALSEARSRIEQLEAAQEAARTRRYPEYDFGDQDRLDDDC